jgi:hypothetical protein
LERCGFQASAFSFQHERDEVNDEIKQMNAYWRLLAGLVNEGLAVVHDVRLPPETRLDRLREKLEFAQQFTRTLPASVKTELDANPAVQAALADSAAVGKRGIEHGTWSDDKGELRRNDDAE